MKKIVYLLLLHVAALQAQDPMIPRNLPTPTAAELGKYGDIPVSYYTGRANVSIPLWQTSVRGVDLNIALTYETGGLLTNRLPGWMGHGWSLLAGGVITRVVNGEPDEVDYAHTVYSTFQNYFHFYGFLAEHIDNTELITNPNLMQGDTKADVFYFNFMGHTGRFLLGHDGKWKVDSESNLTVLFDYNNSSNYITPFYPTYPANQIQQSHAIKGFTLIDENGTQYVFGGNQSAIDYTIDLFHTSNNEQNNSWMASGWYLTEVRDRLGNMLYSFDYERGKFIVQLCHGYYSIGNPDNTFKYVATLNSPVYIKSIQTLTGDSIAFTKKSAYPMSIASREIYTPSMYDAEGNRTLVYIDMIRRGGSFFYLQSNKTQLTPYQNNSSVSKLEDPLSAMDLALIDKMIVFHGRLHSPASRSFYQFSYDIGKRIFLSNVSVSSNTGQYSFLYKNANQLPQDYLTPQIDHWGYYNGSGGSIGLFGRYPDEAFITNAVTGQQLLTFSSGYREPDTICSQYGMLTDIIYPTGGRTHFEYEQNRYAQCQRGNRNDTSGVAGGVRVKSIEERTSQSGGILLRKRTFSYTDPSGHPTGQLYALPRYEWQWNGFIYKRSCSIVPLSNSFGSHIGYSYVIEREDDGTKNGYDYYNFSDEEDDAFIVTGMTQGVESPFDCFSERSYKLGKLKSKTTYDSQNHIMAETKYTYRADQATMDDQFVYMSNASNIMRNEYENVKTGGIYKLFYPKYDVSTIIQKTRYGVGLVSDTTIFTMKDVTKSIMDIASAQANYRFCTSEMTKRGSAKQTKVYSRVQNLTQGYFPITSVTEKKDAFIVKRDSTYYSCFGGKYLPAAEIRAWRGLHKDTLALYHSYTPTGLVDSYTEKGKPKTKLYWNGNDQLIARVTGNIDFSQIQCAELTADVELNTGAPPLAATTIRNALTYNGQSIFDVPNVEAEYCVYDTSGHLFCVTKGNGQTTFYKYDRHGRLTEVRDKDYHLLHTFQYNYINH